MFSKHELRANITMQRKHKLVKMNSIELNYLGLDPDPFIRFVILGKLFTFSVSDDEAFTLWGC